MTRIGLVALLAVVLAGCSPTPEGTPRDCGSCFPTSVRVGDREIPCVVLREGYAGGISCDWSAP